MAIIAFPPVVGRAANVFTRATRVDAVQASLSGQQISAPSTGSNADTVQ